MIGWLAFKLLRAAFTMWLVVTFVFFVLRLTGDPVQQLLPDDASPEVFDFYRAKWGLDRPIWEQYLAYWASLFEGDFGISFRNNQPAFEMVWERSGKTALLGLTALGFALLIGLPMGALAAMRRDGWVDRTVMSLAVFGFSMPNFFLGILLILIFSLQLRVLPSSGSDSWAHLAMPAFTLGTAFAAQIARFARSAMIDVLNKPYMRTAASKGAGPMRQAVAHAAPNAAIPIVTIVGMKLGELMGSAVVTEVVFAWPGLGRLLTHSVANRDLAVVQCILMLIALTMVTANVATDLLYGWLDPRVRVGRGTGRR